MSSADTSLKNEEELAGMIAAIWDGRILLAIVTTVVLAASIAVWAIAPPIYVAGTTLAVNARDSDQGDFTRLLGQFGGLAGFALGETGDARTIAIEILRSRAFALEFMNAESVKQVIFEDRWDSAEEEWIGGESAEPSDWQAFEIWDREIFSVVEDTETGIVTALVYWGDPVVAANWANSLIELANQKLKNQAIQESEWNLTYLAEQMRATSVDEVRQAISELIENEMASMMIASGNREFAFQVIDPAVPQEEPWFPRFWPLFAFGAIAGPVLGIVATLIRAYLKGNKLSPELPEKS